MHPQLIPMMQLGPRGAITSGDASRDIAVVSGGSALASAPTADAPHPTIRTVSPAARSAAFDLRILVIPSKL
jgi:hypothetical protein